MKFNLASKFYSKFNQLLSDAETEPVYGAPEVSEPVFWSVFLLALLVAVVFAPLRRWLG